MDGGEGDAEESDSTEEGDDDRMGESGRSMLSD